VEFRSQKSKQISGVHCEFIIPRVIIEQAPFPPR